METVTIKDDAALVAVALDGGPEAFAPIVARYKEAVFGVTLARLRHFHDAEDAAQNAFIKAYTGLGGLKDPDRLGAWLRAIAIRCADDCRARRPETASQEKTNDLLAQGGTPLEALERQERRDTVLHTVGRLSKAQRETVTLFYLGGHGLKEIATLLEVPLGTVKRRLHDARQRLRKEMLNMVEEVLRDEAPKEEFADRVFQLLNLHDSKVRDRWSMMEELNRIAAAGAEGFGRALALPHTSSRTWTLTMMRHSPVPATEELIAMVKQCLKDPSKKVRRRAASVMMGLDVPEQRRYEEFVPLMAALLFDKSRIVRRFAANPRRLGVLHYPLELVIAARARETDAHNRGLMERIAEMIAEQRLAQEGGLPND